MGSWAAACGGERQGLVGGGPLNEDVGKAVGADAYCRDAAVTVEMAKDLMHRMHNQLPAAAG